MPFKSKAQRRKFAQLLVEGKITDEQYEEWNRSTGDKQLPERVRKPTRAKGKTRPTSKRAVGRKKSATRTRAAPRKRATPKRRRAS
jgi:hypothetical protein